MSDAANGFARDGYVVFRDCLPPEDLKALRKDFLAHDVGTLSRMGDATDTGLWDRHAIAERIGRTPALIRMAQTLLGCRGVRLWQDQVIVKRAWTGAVTEWHRDAPYWPMREARALTCWIPLGHVCAESSALRFRAGSHRDAEAGTILPLCWRETNPSLLGGDKQDDAQTLEMRLGDCSFHDGLVLHGAHGNTAPDARVAYKLVYMAEGTRFRLQWHSATAKLDLHDGDLLEGSAFPRLD